MGHSQTINVIGFSAEVKIDEKTSSRYECHAMNKMEMAQKKKYMEEQHTPIIGWLAQTKTGCKMIGAEDIWEEIPDNKVKHVNLITCPICNGIGRIVNNSIASPYCMVCNGSGITKNKYWEKWQPWQLEETKKSFELNN